MHWDITDHPDGGFEIVAVTPTTYSSIRLTIAVGIDVHARDEAHRLVDAANIGQDTQPPPRRTVHRD